MILSIISCVIIVFCVFVFGKHTNNDNGEVLSIQTTTVMRGIAILMVVIHHLSLWLGTNIFTPLGGGGVAIFMILSGYGLTMSYQKNGVRRFWWKRFIGIFIPWVNIILLFMQPWKLIGYEWFWKYLFFIDYGPWYMQYLFVWYIIFYLSHCAKWLHRIRWYFVAFAALLMFIYWEPMQQEQSLCFPLGMWIGENYERVKKINRRIYLKAAIVAAVVAVIVLSAKQIPSIRNDVSSLLFITLQLMLKTSMAVTVIMAVPFVSFLFRSRYLWFTGLISYELYLIHGIVNDHLQSIIGISFQTLSTGMNVLYIISFLCTLYVSCYLLFRVNEWMIRTLNLARKVLHI